MPKVGRPRTLTDPVMITLRINGADAERLASFSQLSGRTQTYLIRQAISFLLDTVEGMPNQTLDLARK